VLVVGAKAPKLVSNELVSRMRHGSVLVDIAVDQGGCFEALVPRLIRIQSSSSTVRSSIASRTCLARAQHVDVRVGQRDLAYTLELARHAWREAALADAALAEGVNVVNGSITYGPVARRSGMRAHAAQFDVEVVTRRRRGSGDSHFRSTSSFEVRRDGEHDQFGCWSRYVGSPSSPHRRGRG